MTKDTALALLGLRENELTDKRINEAFRNAMRMNHPDRYGHDEQLRRHAEEQCKLINEARDVLLNGTWDEARNYEQEKTYSDARAERESDASEQPTGNGPAREQKPFAQGASETGVVTSQTPLLDAWKTPVLCSVLGVVCYFVLNGLENTLLSNSVLLMYAEGSIRIGAQIAYAAFIYPSFFGSNPRIHANETVAFCNCIFGSFLFGAVWNHNLTKKSKGVSNSVYVVCNVAFVVLFIAWRYMRLHG